MSTSSSDRDETGRFVKPESPASTPDVSETHPMAKILFGWVEAPKTPLILLMLVILTSAALIVLDVLVMRNEYVGFANADWFYGLWGFGAFALAVLSGWPLGRLLRRDEDYYGEADITPDDIDPEIEP